jgi:hypothetical protein
MEKNLDLDVRLTLRRSMTVDELKLPKITFQSSLMSIGFQFQRQQVSGVCGGGGNQIFNYLSHQNLLFF